MLRPNKTTTSTDSPTRTERRASRQPRTTCEEAPRFFVRLLVKLFCVIFVLLVLLIAIALSPLDEESDALAQGRFGLWAGNLLNSSEEGDIVAVRKRLKVGMHSDKNSALRATNTALPPNGRTPLIAASRRGHTEVMTALLDAGVSLHQEGPSGLTASVEACMAGQPHAYAALQKAGGSVDRYVSMGRYMAGTGFTGEFTPLIIVAREVAQLEAMGRSAVQAAVDDATEHERIKGVVDEELRAALRRLRLLAVMCDADVRLGTKPTGWTALHHAASLGGVETARALLQVGVDPNQPDAINVTALMVAANVKDSRGLVKALCNFGADANHLQLRSIGEGGGLVSKLTPLMISAKGGHADAVSELLARGARPDHGGGGWNPLTIASEAAATDVVRALLRAGASTTWRTSRGLTALEVARAATSAEEGFAARQAEVVQLLLEAHDASRAGAKPERDCVCAYRDVE